MILFKSKKIHLDCFTYRQDLYELSPIVKGTKMFPDWWKKLPNSKFNFDEMRLDNTMRSCSGFIDFFRNSVSIPMWTDLALRVDAEEVGNVHWRFSDDETLAIAHPTSQYAGYVDDSVQHLKIETPWQFSTKEDVKWVWSGNPWNDIMLNRVVVLPAVVEYKNQHATALQIMISKQKERNDYLIKHGTPVVNLFPMSDKQVEIHNHLVSLEEYNKLYDKSKPIVFSKKYSYIKNLCKKKNEETKKGKCPFHF